MSRETRGELFSCAQIPIDTSSLANRCHSTAALPVARQSAMRSLSAEISSADAFDS